MNRADTIASTQAWYSRISEEARVALKLVGVRWEEFNHWTGSPFFASRTQNWIPKFDDDPEAFARRILDDIARTAGSAAKP